MGATLLENTMQEQPNPFQSPTEPRSSYGPPIPSPDGSLPTVFAHGGLNDSGTGGLAVLPPELKGFSWAAFLMNWIWSIAHNTWIGLLVFIVPFPIMQIVLGVKGNEWAWQNRKWDSIEQFRATQRVWLMWGIGLTILGVIFGLLGLIMLFSLSALTAGSQTIPRP